MTQTFNQLFYEYNNRFIRFAQSYIGDRAAAEDIVADAFVYYWENRTKLSPDTNAPAYILTSVKNKCIHHLQHARVKVDVSSKIQAHSMWELGTRIATLEACDPEEFFTKEIQEIIARTLKRLPEKTRRVFLLSRYDNLSNKEIAERLGITVKGVEFHITKAIKLLRVELKDYLSILLFFIEIQ